MNERYDTLEVSKRTGLTLEAMAEALRMAYVAMNDSGRVDDE